MRRSQESSSKIDLFDAYTNRRQVIAFRGLDWLLAALLH